MIVSEPLGGHGPFGPPGSASVVLRNKCRQYQDIDVRNAKNFVMTLMTTCMDARIQYHIFSFGCATGKIVVHVEYVPYLKDISGVS